MFLIEFPCREEGEHILDLPHLKLTTVRDHFMLNVWFLFQGITFFTLYAKGRSFFFNMVLCTQDDNCFRQ